MEVPAHGWTGPPPTALQQGATYFVGIVGVLFAGVGPLLLGGLEASGRISAAQLGEAGTAELLTMGLGAALAGKLLGTGRLRLVTLLCGLAMAALNLATTRVSGDGLTAVRALVGVPSGILIWLVTGMILRSPSPGRGSGVYLTAQTLAQLLVVAAITAFILEPFGVDGGFLLLGALGLATACVGLAVPATYAPLAESGFTGWPPARGWVALAAVFLFQAFILAMWIYVEPLSRQAGHAPEVAGAAISLSLGAQVAGGALATALAARLRWAPALLGSVAAMLALLGVFALLPAAPLFLAASAAFGFLWIFAAPFLTPLAIEADRSRQAALLGPGASLLGCSAGPFLASLVVGAGDVRPSLAMAAGLALICLALVAALAVTRRGAFG